MWFILASAYGEDVYNGNVYSATTEAAASGGLADTGLYAGIFIVVGLVIISIAILSQRRRKQTNYLT